MNQPSDATREDGGERERLIDRLRSWGENDPDPEFFVRDVLSGVLMDCGLAGQALAAAEARVTHLVNEVQDYGMQAIKAEARASKAEATASALRDRVARLEEALKPFSEASDFFRGQDKSFVRVREANSGSTYLDMLAIGDFRRARAALQGEDDAEEPNS